MIDHGFGVKTKDGEWHLNSYLVFVDFGSPHYFGDFAQFSSRKKALNMAKKCWPSRNKPDFVTIHLS